jgi:hypothetical protein
MNVDLIDVEIAALIDWHISQKRQAVTEEKYGDAEGHRLRAFQLAQIAHPPDSSPPPAVIEIDAAQWCNQPHPQAPHLKCKLKVGHSDQHTAGTGVLWETSR